MDYYRRGVLEYQILTLEAMTLLKLGAFESWRIEEGLIDCFMEFAEN